MTDKQRAALLAKARGHLARTTQGHVQYAKTKKGSEWKAADAALAKLAKDLQPKVPALGPIWHGGQSVLLHDLTHATAGIQLFPAFDDAYVQGREIIAPEPLTVYRSSSSHPGMAFYATGASKLRYWFGHLDRTHSPGRKFAKGEVVGRVAPNSIGGGPHCHVGINVELLLGAGKQLQHHTNYTHGAPTIGAQLNNALN